jgi:hypothetical protein
VRVGTARDGQGRDGPWKGAVELRRKQTRGVSKWGGGGRNIRLDAAALSLRLERRLRLRGLASGWRVGATVELRIRYNTFESARM